ncbi:Putative band 7 family protein R614 OS=Acanthamoeba polyphaga mimivirus GN=MIMI_R614 PE=3 SV=1 [Rhizoctonia solani AG-1 IB]|uniref:Putative band 7 family protein R614 n=1 Tax=Thanatephorus cucumeris (strain AG1-IB / isolate 7/3/14) TaxID=1108050 RepID=A0A0B7G5Y7_THACB|nr:Putative band 7 family protein R614 OS=Acanthamoeba polyphaga mimivirus GN=MIMI_R614 PE=3 SV=1 [Rhizoctonia solani AG-1 IB]
MSSHPDSKAYRQSSPSLSSGHSNVVDHNAPDVTVPESSSALRRAPAAGSGNGKLITVEPLKKTEMQQSYAQDLGLGGVEHGIYGSFINALGAVVGFFGAIPCCPCPNPFQEVQQGSVGLVTRFGQFYRAVDPGLVQVNVCSEELRRVDVKIQIASIGRQTVITRDNVNVEIESVIYYQITHPYRAAFGIADLRQALIERSQTTLRHVVGARVVQSVVTERDAIALEIEEIVADVASKWGVAIEGILIKDITFPPDVAASLSSAAQAKRVGESKVIAARAEVDAARLMRQAADILASPAAMQIRQLEALQTMAKSAQSKVVFVPMNLQGDVSAQLSGGQWSGSGQHHDSTQSPGAGPTMLGGSQGAAQRAGLLTSMADL